MTMLNDNLFWDKMSLSAFLSHAENETERTAMILTNSEVSLGDKMIAGLMKQIQFVKPDSDRKWLYGCLWLLIRFYELETSTNYGIPSRFKANLIKSKFLLLLNSTEVYRTDPRFGICKFEMKSVAKIILDSDKKEIFYNAIAK